MFPSNNEGVHSPHFDEPMGLSLDHPLVLDFSDERIFIPFFPFSTSPKLEVVSLVALEESAAVTPTASDMGVLCK